MEQEKLEQERMNFNGREEEEEKEKMEQRIDVGGDGMFDEIDVKEEQPQDEMKKSEQFKQEDKNDDFDEEFN